MGGVASHSLGRRGQERLASQEGVRWPWNELLGGSLTYRRKLKLICLFTSTLPSHAVGIAVTLLWDLTRVVLCEGFEV